MQPPLRESLETKLRFYSQVGREDIAERLLRSEMLSQGMAGARAWLVLGQLRYRQGFIKQSQAILKQGLQQRPDDSELRMCLALTHLDQGHYNQAML